MKKIIKKKTFPKIIKKKKKKNKLEKKNFEQKTNTQLLMNGFQRETKINFLYIFFNFFKIFLVYYKKPDNDKEN